MLAGLHLLLALDSVQVYVSAAGGLGSGDGGGYGRLPQNALRTAQMVWVRYASSVGLLEGAVAVIEAVGACFNS